DRLGDWTQRFGATGPFAAGAGVEEGEAAAEGALAVGVGVERFAAAALGDGEAADPLGAGLGGTGVADPVRAAVAELVAVEGMAEVEELGAGDGGHLAQGGDYRIDRGGGGPIGVGVPERAAAFGQPLPLGLRIAQPAAGREGGGVAAEHQPVVAAAVAGAAQ